MQDLSKYVGRVVESKNGSNKAIIQKISEIEVELKFSNGKVDTITPAFFHRYWKDTGKYEERGAVTGRIQCKEPNKSAEPKGEPIRKLPPKIDFSELISDISKHCEKQHCEMKKTSQYIAVRFKHKNIAEIHVKRCEILLVVNQKSIPEEVAHQAEVVPKSFGWVLDTRFKYSLQDGPANAKQVLDYAIAYYDKKLGG